MNADESKLATIGDVRTIVRDEVRREVRKEVRREVRKEVRKEMYPLKLLIEEVIGQNKLVLEIVADLQRQVSECAKQSDLDEVKRDVKTMKLAIALTNRQVHNHEGRIRKLEMGQSTG